MKLEKLIITGFGKLNNFEVEFKEGLNIIIGSNESGKSTMQAFIKAMLFGQKKGRNENLIEKERFKPWGGGIYGGSLQYLLVSKGSFRVWRDFNTGQVKVFDSGLRDITDSFGYSKGSGVLFAEEHLGVNQEIFTRTSFVLQMGVRLNTEGEVLLTERIASIVENGSERASYTDAKKALEKVLLEEIGTSRTTGKPLDKVNYKIKKLEAEKDSCEGVLKRILDLEIFLKDAKEMEFKNSEEVQYIKAVRDAGLVRESFSKVLSSANNIKLLEAQRKQKMLELDSLNSKITDGISIFDDEISNELTSIENRINYLRSRKTNLFRYACMMLVLAAFALTLAVSKLWYIGISLLLASLAGLFLTSNKIIEDNRSKDLYNRHDFKGCKISELESQLKDILFAARVESIARYHERKREISFIVEKRELINKSVELISNQISIFKMDNKDSAEMEKNFEQNSIWIHQIYNRMRFKKEIPLPEDLIKKRLEELEAYYENTVEKLKHVQLRVKEIETEIKVIMKEIERLPSIEEELSLAISKRQELEEFGYCIRKALEFLKESSEEVKEDITPRLVEKVSGITQRLTGHYSDIRTNVEGKGMRVSLADGNVIPLSCLSGGTIDQIYLALRLAVAEVISSNCEPLPLIFDEVFSQYDENRLNMVANYLINICKNRQVILFTCKESEANIIIDTIPQANLICLNRD